ncbi:MAG: hypothetical protein K2Y22_15535 [Candidatus Obscuribacterales bacterium]|nr:hypothetical protein [Candidatus Obscuribacterales bacterium]
MSPQYLDSSETTLQMSNAQIFLYGVFAAIVALCFTCCTSIGFWQLSRLDSESENDFNQSNNVQTNIDESALNASLLKYFGHSNSTHIEHRLLKPYIDPYKNACYPWVYLFDKTKLLSQGITEVHGGKTDLRITKFVNSKMIVEEPAFAADLVPGYASIKLFKIARRAEPQLTSMKNASELKQIFQQNESIFEKVKEMLASEKAINRVSFCHINDIWIPDYPELPSRKDTILPTKRYNEYLTLLDQCQCVSVSYGSEIGRRLPTSGNEIWFQMWQSLTGQQLAEWIVYSKDGSIPKNSLKQGSIDSFVPRDKNHRWVAVPINTNWYIVRGYRANPLGTPDEYSPSDEWLRTLYRDQKNKLAELADMLARDRSLQAVEPDYVQAWKSSRLPINKAIEQGIITSSRHQKYFDLLVSLRCISCGFESETSKNNTNELWYYFWMSNHNKAGKFLVFNKSGRLPSGCTEVTSTDIGDFRHSKETLYKCVRIGPQWFIVSAVWAE